MAAEVFISYAHKDREQVVAWVQRLQGAGVSLWIDERGIEGATLWEEEIVEAIVECTVVLLMLSTASTASPHVAREVALALDEKKVILPVTLEPITLPATLRYALAGIQRIDLANADVPAKLDALCRALALSGVNLTPEAIPAEQPKERCPHNLPRSLTSFVGREQEIAEVRELLAAGNSVTAAGASPGAASTAYEARLVTLTGPGGAGKTRLALAVATSVLEEYPDGVFLVELHALTSPELVLQAVATTLGVREQPGLALLETLTAHLHSRRLLLLLDNCEHVVGACAELVHTLLRACPRLEILATSQEPLGLSGETVWPVPPLSLPEAGVQAFRRSGVQEPNRQQLTINAPLSEVGTPEHLNTRTPEHPALVFEAVRLFVERARSVQPDFEIGDEEADGIVQICRQLDGIPLAIELAAARVKLLTIEQIAARLDDRFRLLTRGDRTAPRRQQTLLEALNWSHDLLAEPERALLRRLSIFAGGWTLEAVEAICGEGGVGPWALGLVTDETVSTAQDLRPNAQRLTPDAVLDLLGRLVDKSLVVAEEREGEGRYRLLETIRRYGALRLAEAGEAAEMRRRHAVWHRQMAEQAEAELRGSKQGVWLARLELEQANLREALARSVEAGESETALRLVGALARFWAMRGYLAEGRERAAAALAVAGSARTVHGGKALHGAGVLALHQGDYPAASTVLAESLALYRELGERTGIAAALDTLGLVALERGDCATARARLEESRTIRQELGDRWGIAATLGNLALVAQEEGDYVAARGLHEASLAIERELGNQWGMAAALDNLGLVDTEEGQYAAARARHEQSLALREELGDKGGIASTLDNMGYLSRCQGDCGRAAALYAESLAMARDLGDKDAMTESLEALAVVAAMQQQPERAARLFGAADALLEAIHAPLPFAERDDYERAIISVRATLGEGAFVTARAEGYAMPLEAALAYALEPMSSA